MDTLNRIMQVMKQKGITQKELCERLGLTKNVFTAWKSGKTNSYFRHIKEISAILEVSSDYLLGSPTMDALLRLAKEANASVAYLLGDVDSPDDRSKTHWAELHPTDEEYNALPSKYQDMLQSLSAYKNIIPVPEMRKVPLIGTSEIASPRYRKRPCAAKIATL